MLHIHRLVLALLPVLFLMSVPGFAKNVPGSAAAAQGRVDRQVASSLINNIVQSALDSSRFNGCDAVYSENAQDRGSQCTWGFSARGEMLFLNDDPSGFDYESTNGLGNVMLSRWISPGTILVGGVLFEAGSTDTSFNSGRVDHKGLGGVIGVIHEISPDMELSLLGGVEGLTFDVSRSNGLFKGDYDATRLFGDAALTGQAGDDGLWFIYRGGLRVLQQYNGSYHERSGGVVVNTVKGVDLFTLSLVGDVKIGTTIEGIRPFIQLSGVADLVHDESLGVLGIGIDDEILTGRIGAGFDAAVLEGLLSMSGGVHFADQGYKGFDVLISFSKDF